MFNLTSSKKRTIIYKAATLNVNHVIGNKSFFSYNDNKLLKY